MKSTSYPSLYVATHGKPGEISFDEFVEFLVPAQARGPARAAGPDVAGAPVPGESASPETGTMKTADAP